MLQFERMVAIQMRKHTELAFIIYFCLLMFLVIFGVKDVKQIVNLIYLVVILSGFLKYILIVNKNKK